MGVHGVGGSSGADWGSNPDVQQYLNDLNAGYDEIIKALKSPQSSKGKIQELLGYIGQILKDIKSYLKTDNQKTAFDSTCNDFTTISNDVNMADYTSALSTLQNQFGTDLENLDKSFQ